MKIAIGSDHGGYILKEEIRAELEAWGHEVIDFGCNSDESTDYPQYAHSVAEEVQTGKVERGVLICTTGIGISIAANRHKGVRAALCRNCDMTYLTRIHNNANVIAFGSRYTTILDARAMLRVFLDAQYSNEQRHTRRIEGIELEVRG